MAPLDLAAVDAPIASVFHSSPLLSLAFAALLCGCSAPHHQASSEPPAIVIDQLPDYPMPGRGSDFPGGVVAALWRDGRMIRSITPKAVGKSYVEGMVATEQREEFFRFLSAAVVRAPKPDGIPLHVATQSISIRTGGGTSEWTRTHLIPEVARIIVSLDEH